MIKSWKLARPKIKYLRVLSLSLCFLAFTICISLYLKSDGLDRLALTRIEEQVKDSDISLSYSGPRVYEFYAEKYRVLSISFLIFLIAKGLEGIKWSLLFRRKLIFQIIAFCSLGIAAYSLWEVFYWKYKLSETYSWTTSLYSLLRSSVLLDWVCLALIILLFVIQLFESFQIFLTENEIEINKDLSKLN